MDIRLQCKCGQVQGVAHDISPANGNRIVCCCDDCQAFANHLPYAGQILDEFGGTDIFQTSQSQIRITEGADQLACSRLKPKGLYRWHTRCCHTPVGNTLNAGMPFIGVFHNFMVTDNRDELLGPVRAYVQTLHATGTPTYPHSSKKFPLGNTLRVIRLLLSWKIRGMAKPSPFFKQDGTTTVEPKILSEQNS